MCVYLNRQLGYKIEDILNKSYEWVDLVSRETMKQEFQETIFQLSLHGASKEEIDKMRQRFYNSIEDKKEQTLKDIRIPISYFQGLGIKAGKPTGTKFVRK